MYVLVIVCYGSVKRWLWNDITWLHMVESHHIVNSKSTQFFFLNDVLTVFLICSWLFIKWLGKIVKIFLTRLNFLVYLCKNYPVQIAGVGSLLAAWNASAEDIFVKTAVLKVPRWCIVTAAWMKYWFVVFPIFGLHKAMITIQR